MPEEAGVSRTAPSGPLPYYRVPPPFGGKAEEDVDAWLTKYKRVGKSNGWDAAAMLANVVFSLTDTALVWYENHEDALTTWDLFVEELRACFGDSVARKKRAEQTLSQRAQLPGETCTTYIEEVLRLCKVVCATMSEEDKVGHLLKGIAEDVYNFLIGKESLSSVSDVIQHCRTFETLKMRRIAPKFGRLANVTTVASVDTNPGLDLFSTIRQIVREELSHREMSCSTADHRELCLPREAMDVPPLTPWQPTMSAATVEYSPAPQSRMTTRFPASRYDRRSQRMPPRHPTSRYDAPDQYIRHTRANDDALFIDERPTFRPRPVCYSCGVPGHISRFCNRRVTPRYHQPSDFSRPFEQPHGVRRPAHIPPDDNYWPSSFRNHSPASDRSLTPPPRPRAHRSPSPLRRKAPSSPPEN